MKKVQIEVLLAGVEIGGIKLTFASLPTMICAMLFGPIDGFLVGFLGAFLEQMLKYGFTTTTLLWVLPPAIRGLFIRVCALLLKDRLLRDLADIRAFHRVGAVDLDLNFLHD